ncbi:hypothetical protein ACJRO7_025231 [Eucalyptus globulus]|uniref:non-specific serine/threonine protein kinase n=1 Tax=Eucalyptus globulus TaxID=34317 RepID=A0ABD3KGT0_EUCGL
MDSPSNTNVPTVKLALLSLLMFSCHCIRFSVVYAAEMSTISVGQSLTGSDTLVSSGGVFELGFFSPENSSDTYLGTWYKKIAERTVVWVGNKDLPLTTSTPALAIVGANLVIQGGRTTYDLSDNSVSGNVSATLLDSGNFVLREESSEAILWQSFDDPSDTFLPGMKLGYSRKTGKVWALTSWKNAADPSPGDFSLRIDSKSPDEFVVLKGSEKYWTSGLWDRDSQTFSLAPEMTLNGMFNFSFISNQNESYLTYSLYSSSNVSTRLVMDLSGQIKQLSWLESPKDWLLFWSQPRDPCDVYKLCGSFSRCSNNTFPSCACLIGFRPLDQEKWQQNDTSGGCVRRQLLQCTKTGHENGYEGFLRMNHVTFPLYYNVSERLSPKACKSVCSGDCSCTAYAYNGSGTGRCLLWYQDLLNLRRISEDDPNSNTIYIKLATSELQNSRGINKTLKIALASAVPLVAFFLTTYMGCQWKKKMKGKMGPTQDILLFDVDMSVAARTNETSVKGIGNEKNMKDALLPLFSFSSVTAATQNFSNSNKLGEGGFGPVYKGKLLNGKHVAVKRLSKKSTQGMLELRNETMLIAKLQHKNLVRLLGCCLERDEKILIYEYMPNKSLDSFLFDQAKRRLLNWGKRVHIIEGITQGLIYLHQHSRLRIVHRDLKASNILLDSEMNPKIADFGLAKIFGGNESEANTNRIVGTYGYMSPEYALEGIISIKSDVFSFGVLLLEIISGKKNTGFYQTDSMDLLGHSSLFLRQFHEPLSARTATTSMDSPRNTNMPTMKLALLSLLMFSCHCIRFSVVVAAATTTISVRQSLTGSDTLVSSGGVFELGFFSPGNSSDMYLGIWYKKIEKRTYVWVGNRDRAFTTSAPALAIDRANLVILDGNMTYKLSNDSVRGNVSATLLDSGNFVLREDSSEAVLWQSFDDPLDTFLPGMKLGYSRKTGKVWALTSWKNAMDPSTGEFSLRMASKISYGFYIWNASKTYWTSGVWNPELQIFSLIPEMSLNSIFNFSFISNFNEVYFTYSLYGSFGNTSTHLVMDLSGQIRQQTYLETSKEWSQLWSQPRQECDVYRFCGSFSICNGYPFPSCDRLDGFRPSDQKNWQQNDTSAGCVRRIQLQCEQMERGNGDKDGFLKMDHVKLPDYPNSMGVISTEACEAACSDNYLFNLEELPQNYSSGQTIYVRLAAYELQNKTLQHSRGINKALKIALASAVPLVALFIAISIGCQWKKTQKGKLGPTQDILLFDVDLSIAAGTEETSRKGIGNEKNTKDAWLPLFSFSSVTAATENFANLNKLGEGGFGPVYKLQHKNLVRLLGCCLERDEKILIYEYMPNKSLDSFLFDQAKRHLLNWEKRAHIIEGIAQGLVYFHQHSRLRIVHRDLKASNILLDTEMNPKIADFGLAKMFGGNESEANTNRIVGTYGYMSPEYALEGGISIKSDVFSFGAWQLRQEDRALCLVDSALENHNSDGTLMRHINVALLCVQENAADRPTMSEVLTMLTNELSTLPSPKQPAFSYIRTQKMPEPPLCRLDLASVNDVTLSVMEAR